ncbi:MAG: flavin reductase family protein [Lachnospiraceae bacterium]|nr:flavin reductase family protein [Lachnospiraceae bacterium]
MAKQVWKPGNLLNPVPIVMVSCRSKEGKDNIITIGWAGTICSDPCMVSISVRKERYSHPIISESGEFVINLVSRNMANACDLCGVKSGRDVDKFELAGLHKLEADKVNVAVIEESPLSLECKVKQVLELGSHDMFVAEVVAVDVDESLLDDKGRLDLQKADLVCYSHGEYFALGDKLGSFGYSVRKK